MIEEAEHKTVAFDVYMAQSGTYVHRAIGVFHGSLHVLGYGMLGMFTALKKDKLFWTIRGQVGIARMLGSIIWNIGPSLLNALLPWHNPRDSSDTEWFHDWVDSYPDDDPKWQPLVDTSHPEMPTPYS